MSDLKKCPFCNCYFCSNADLESHLDAFGRKSSSHERNFNRKHSLLENGLSRAHGGADKALLSIEEIILAHKRMLMMKKKRGGLWVE